MIMRKNIGIFIALVSVTVTLGSQGPCQDEYDRLERRRQNGIAKYGIPPLGMSFPTCLDDGNYAGLQCRGPWCKCVTGEGNELIAFQDIATSRSMTCKCVRDKHEYRLTRRIGLMYRCDEIGNYRSVQCTGSMCYCVNSSGEQQGESVHVTKSLSLNC